LEAAGLMTLRMEQKIWMEQHWKLVSSADWLKSPRLV
jgi:hypothetical protein